ncbi:tRNA (adenosine(37)-N6)-threonylcarbamoyltransferase complex dimerization subunit type 1 TsaB [Phaeovulum vinaykumarii]|uniref:tRNA threonylcarbamoyl adenosine modification protein YeaZ n=1 Tax=Phaeovulum vinaykumarii TaxID=407234 RepID=A0A1N7M9P9_9RHOB|nr:tRNA (adenosine(37)-N6)-threonylcarbamoyltransferase complex dimerization subunit type 1 TsaB [Phaeovulum vinaykumarii]SIS82826.1 tRNA threonylcarbamoyl adenosine modification protein YeaZ [Phaeovulum vinaykumarii]SOC10625.1 tRNA threonylcarbamoyl adenosine modification protein YeaZ [Phaeovulum vinaykumarii]
MRPEPGPVLAFDTSAAHCAAALVSAEGARIAARHEEMARGQAERLMPLLEETLAEAGLGWRDLGGLAVGVGPGNFTGVRISVAAARGLALALGLPVHGIGTLEALAEGLPRPLVVAEDARRGEIYWQLFEDAPSLPASTSPALGLPGDVPRLPGLRATGSAAQALGLATLAPAQPLAVAMAQIAAARLAAGTLPQGRPAPLYLRAADAAPPSDPAPVIV